MPYPLHKVPPGFLGLLNAKVNGRNPLQYAEQVAPTLDMTEFYALPQIELVRLTNAAVPSTFQGNHVVPSGEVWRVRRASVTGFFNSGTNVNSPVIMEIGIASPSGFSVVVERSWDAALGALTTDRVLTLSPAIGEWIPAGWSIQVGIFTNVTNPGTYSASSVCLFDRFPA